MNLLKIVLSTAISLIACVITPPAQAQSDLGNFDLMKTHNLVQNSATSVVPDPDEPYQFSSFVNGATTGSYLLSSSLTPPSGATATPVYDLTPQGPQVQLQLQYWFSSKAAMDTAFPNGTPANPYTLTVWTSTPHSYPNQLAFGSDNYPAAIPQVTNVVISNTSTAATWNSAGSLVIDPTKSYTFTFSGTASNASFSINNTSINNVAITGNQFVLPSTTGLSANTTYRGQIQVNNNQTNGTGNANFQDQVVFIIQTAQTLPASSSPNIIQKKNNLVQTSNSTPVNATGFSIDTNEDPAPYFFNIQTSTPGTVQGPSGTSYPLLYGSDYSQYNFLSGSVSSLTALNSTYLDGSYTMTDGKVLNLSGDVYPNVPQITAVNGLTPVWTPQGRLALDPTVINTLTFTAFNAHNSNYTFSSGGYIQAEVSNWNQTVDVKNQSFGFSGGSLITTLAIPANQLTAGQSYNGKLEFGLVSDYKTNGNTFDAAAYATETSFIVEAEPSTFNYLIQVNTPGGSTWVTSPWLGAVNVSNSSFLYSPFLGFAAPFGQDYRAVWFYDSTMNDYIWTSNNTFPYFYGNKNGKWYFLYTGSSPSSPTYASIYEFNGRGWIFLNQY